MKDVVHIIDCSAPAEMLDQMLILREPDEKIISIGPAPRANGLGYIVRLHKPLGMTSLAGGRLGRAVPPGAILHLWSQQLLGAASRAAERIGGSLVLSIPHLPSGKQLEDLPWVIGSFSCMLTVPTDRARAALLEARADPARVAVLEPVIPVRRQREETRSEVRRAIRAEDDDILLTTTAEMTQCAGHKLVLWAHAIIRRIRQKIRVVLPGSGTLEQSIRSFSRTTGYDGEVSFTGHRFSPAEIEQACDIALFCYQKDCGLNRPVSAMAAALPLIAANTPDLSTLCRHKENALVIQDPGPREISKYIMQLVDDPQLAKDLGGRARCRVEDDFDTATVKKGLREIYDRS
jgi:glycosyltransferase involved in cell wall biosynthesis